MATIPFCVVYLLCHWFKNLQNFYPIELISSKGVCKPPPLKSCRTALQFYILGSSFLFGESKILFAHHVVSIVLVEVRSHRAKAKTLPDLLSFWLGLWYFRFRSCFSLVWIGPYVWISIVQLHFRIDNLFNGVKETMEFSLMERKFSEFNEIRESDKSLKHALRVDFNFLFWIYVLLALLSLTQEVIVSYHTFSLNSANSVIMFKRTQISILNIMVTMAITT